MNFELLSRLHLKDHPFLNALHELEQNHPHLLREIMSIDEIYHVCIYVITDTGKFVLQKSRSRKQLQSFGGCNYPNSIFRMINSLRLELMDESSIILNEDNFICASPLYFDMLGSVLIQAVLLRDSALVDLWSPEKSRNKLGSAVVPSDAVYHPTDKMKENGRFVSKYTQEQAQASSWRSCDYATFQLLESEGVFDTLWKWYQSCNAQLRRAARDDNKIVVGVAQDSSDENVAEPDKQAPKIEFCGSESGHLIQEFEERVDNEGVKSVPTHIDAAACEDDCLSQGFLSCALDVETKKLSWDDGLILLRSSAPPNAKGLVSAIAALFSQASAHPSHDEIVASRMNRLVHLMSDPRLQSLRKVISMPWPPILWEEASQIFTDNRSRTYAKSEIVKSVNQIKKQAQIV